MDSTKNGRALQLTISALLGCGALGISIYVGMSMAADNAAQPVTQPEAQSVSQAVTPPAQLTTEQVDQHWIDNHMTLPPAIEDSDISRPTIPGHTIRVVMHTEYSSQIDAIGNDVWKFELNSNLTGYNIADGDDSTRKEVNDTDPSHCRVNIRNINWLASKITNHPPLKLWQLEVNDPANVTCVVDNFLRPAFAKDFPGGITHNFSIWFATKEDAIANRKLLADYLNPTPPNH